MLSISSPRAPCPLSLLRGTRASFRYSSELPPPPFSSQIGKPGWSFAGSASQMLSINIYYISAPICLYILRACAQCRGRRPHVRGPGALILPIGKPLMLMISHDARRGHEPERLMLTMGAPVRVATSWRRVWEGYRVLPSLPLSHASIINRYKSYSQLEVSHIWYFHPSTLPPPEPDACLQIVWMSRSACWALRAKSRLLREPQVTSSLFRPRSFSTRNCDSKKNVPEGEEERTTLIIWLQNPPLHLLWQE